MILLSGIDVNFFPPHSTRAAAKQAGVSIQDIMQNAGWTNSMIFLKYYDSIIVQEKDGKIANTILGFLTLFCK